MNRTRVIAISGSGVLAAIASVVLATWAYYRFVPPAAGAAHPEEAGAFAAAAAQFSGRIVWSSNRSGNHEIVLLDVQSGSPRLVTLTKDPHVDTFPRFTPDGSKILFNRSRRPWVSARDTDAWDVWIMNVDGSGARRIAEHGYHATFAPSGKAVIFTRGSKILRVKLDGGEERVLLDAAEGLGERIYEPDLARGRLAITVRGGRRTFGVYDPAQAKYTKFSGPSCQVAWWPGGERLYWIENTGHGGNRVVSGDAKGGDARTLIDLPGKYSHEYFPRVSRDGRWLVLGASTGGHEHDRADYEIFLWKVGEPAERARRLTHHSGNDQWPDVFTAEAAPVT